MPAAIHWILLALAALTAWLPLPSRAQMPDWGQQSWVVYVPGGASHGCVGTGERQGCPRWVRDLCEYDRKNKGIGHLKAHVVNPKGPDITIPCAGAGEAKATGRKAPAEAANPSKKADSPTTPGESSSSAKPGPIGR